MGSDLLELVQTSCIFVKISILAYRDQAMFCRSERKLCLFQLPMTVFSEQLSKRLTTADCHTGARMAEPLLNRDLAVMMSEFFNQNVPNTMHHLNKETLQVKTTDFIDEAGKQQY